MIAPLAVEKLSVIIIITRLLTLIFYFVHKAVSCVSHGVIGTQLDHINVSIIA